MYAGRQCNKLFSRTYLVIRGRLTDGDGKGCREGVRSPNRGVERVGRGGADGQIECGVMFADGSDDH